MNLLKDKKIAIIGGGPGGLTLARLLQLKGADVKVYERDFDKHVRVQGATLDLHQDSGLEALREAGLMEAFKANYRPGADKLRITDKNATILVDQHTEEKEDDFDDPWLRPEIDRGPLRQLLLDSLQPETIVWNSQFVSLNKTNEGIELTFKNGNTAFADLVIAADGANSKIRPYLTSIKPFYSGVTIIEGAVYNSAISTPEIHELLNGGKLFAMGNEKTLILSSKGDGSIVYYLGFKTEEKWCKESAPNFNNNEEVKAWFKQEFPDWNSCWLDLFNKAELPFLPRPQYCMPLDQTWEPQSNLTMLGDAAHLMPPYAGEGVNMAMQDALELSRCLTNATFTDLKEAIAHYENQMRLRAAEVAKITLDQTDSLHTENAINSLMEIMS